MSGKEADHSKPAQHAIKTLLAREDVIHALNQPGDAQIELSLPPLVCALKNGQEWMIRALVQAGVDPLMPPCRYESRHTRINNMPPVTMLALAKNEPHRLFENHKAPSLVRRAFNAVSGHEDALSMPPAFVKAYQVLADVARDRLDDPIPAHMAGNAQRQGGVTLRALLADIGVETGAYPIKNMSNETRRPAPARP